MGSGLWAALSAMSVALFAACSLDVSGLAPAGGSSSDNGGSGGSPSTSVTASHSTGVGGGGGGATSSSSATTSSAVTSSSSSGGGGPIKWHSWNVTTDNNQLVAPDESGSNKVVLKPYRSISINDQSIGTLLDEFQDRTHPDAFNAVNGYWAIDSSAKYPYVGKSAVGRAGGMDVPMPFNVNDLQLAPDDAGGNLVVVDFPVPFEGNYTISDLAARRISDSDDNTSLRVLLEGTAMIVLPDARKDRRWVKPSMPSFQLGMLTPGREILFALDPKGNASNDGTQIAWTITKE